MTSPSLGGVDPQRHKNQNESKNRSLFIPFFPHDDLVLAILLGWRILTPKGPFVMSLLKKTRGRGAVDRGQLTRATMKSIGQSIGQSSRSTHFHDLHDLQQHMVNHVAILP